MNVAHACMFVMIHLVYTAVKGHEHASYHHQSCMCMIAFHIIRIACKSNVCHASMGMYVSSFHVNLVMCSGCVCVLGCGPAHCPALVAGHRRRVGRLVGAFVGWALGGGWGGLPCLISGAQMHFQVRVSSQKHEEIFLKGGLRRKPGGVSDPWGAQNQTCVSDFALEFCYSKTI